MSSLFLSDRPQPGDIGVHEGHDETEGTHDGRPWQERLLSGIQLWLDLGIKLGTQLDSLASEQAKLNERLQRFTPIDYQTQAAAPAVAGTPLVLNLGSPDRGTYWELENLVIGGTDVNVTAAGSMGLYVSAQVPSIAGTALVGHGGLINAQDFSPTLPYREYYGRRDIIILDTEWLYAVVFGGTAAQTYAAEASMTVINVAAAGGRDVNID